MRPGKEGTEKGLATAAKTYAGELYRAVGLRISRCFPVVQTEEAHAHGLTFGAMGVDDEASFALLHDCVDEAAFESVRQQPLQAPLLVRESYS